MQPNNKVMEILNKVLAENKPSAKESKKVKKTVDDFISKVKKRKDKLGIKVEVMLGGSVAKGTFLKNKFDSDVFFRFDRSYPDEELSEMLEKILIPWKKNKLIRIHGSRDYFQMIYKKVNFELVPVYKITKPEQAVNVTDASPLHVKWVKQNLTAKLQNSIILTKMFLKAQGIYGAESYIQGFSGHVADVLVIHYGGFINLLKNAAKWKSKVKIDIMKHGKRLNKSKTYSPIIIIDPIQPERNAAAALSKDKFNKFKKKSAEFINNPSKEFFKEKKLSINRLKKDAKEDKLLILKVKPSKGKEDVIGCKILKGFQFFKKNFKMHDFTIIKSGWTWDKSKKGIFWFIIKDVKLERYKKWIGPPTRSKTHVTAFKKKHKKTFIENGKICTKIKRKYMKPEQLIKDLIKDDYLKTKVKECSMKY